METLDPIEHWRRIPPEEKIELISKAHAKGVSAALMIISICGTIAIGLQWRWLLWGSLLLSPLAFQYAASKAWRSFRPKLMLEYLAARSAARRYAYLAKARDLGVVLLLRGTLEREREHDVSPDPFQRGGQPKETPVWFALFSNAFVVMSEGKRGANLEEAHLLDERLVVEPREVGRSRELRFTCTRKKGASRFVLRSRYPAALLVFEKKLLSQLSEEIRAIEEKRRMLELSMPREERNLWQLED